MVRTELVTGCLSEIDNGINDMIHFLESERKDVRIRDIQFIGYFPKDDCCRYLIVYEIEECHDPRRT